MPDPSRRHVAVLDVGKTNAKLVLVDLGADLEASREIDARVLPNEMRDAGPYPHVDVDRIFDFALDGLATFQRRVKLDALSFTTHGAAAALLRSERLALPVLDYEFDGPDQLTADYDRLRPNFAETFSPRLRQGLNLGAQLYWQSVKFAADFDRADRIVTYPQYWAWRFSGVAAIEVTSLASQSDLWNPEARKLSSLVTRQGWDRKLAPLRSAFDVLGPIRADLADRLGLARDTPVYCGIHDLNASLLPHLVHRRPPFALVSSGTWIVVFGVGAALDRLDPARNTMANVDAFGRPVPSSLFMGGREFEMLTGGAPRDVDDTAVHRVLERGIMALPSIIPGSGPFPKMQGGWAENRQPENAAEATAAATFYLALMTETCLGLIGAAGTIVIEGPIARNRLYCQALSTLTGRPVAPSKSSTGTSGGAALLTRGALQCDGAATGAGTVAAFADAAGLRRYADEWRRLKQRNPMRRS